MLGATETSFGLMWATFVVLAARPDVQLKIREEQVGCAENFNVGHVCGVCCTAGCAAQDM